MIETPEIVQTAAQPMAFIPLAVASGDPARDGAWHPRGVRRASGSGRDPEVDRDPAKWRTELNRPLVA